jgi:hypothetical protein
LKYKILPLFNNNFPFMAYTKDQRIINENPTLTAYELLMQKGLSQEKYNELIQANYQPKAKIQPEVQKSLDKHISPLESEQTKQWRESQKITPPTPVAPTVKRAADPKLSRPQQPNRAHKANKMAYLVNKTTKKKTYMTRASAEFAARLDKNFEVR